jgi:hypothetical protein
MQGRTVAALVVVVAGAATLVLLPSDRDDEAPSRMQRARPQAPASEAGIHNERCGTVERGFPVDEDDVTVDAITFFGLGQARALVRSAFGSARARGGRRPAYKTVTQVAAGRSVTVIVPPEQRDRLALIFAGFRSSGWYRLTDGQIAVRFRACGKPGSGYVYYNGGFIVGRPGCTYFVVLDAAGTPTRRNVGFATRSRCL